MLTAGKTADGFATWLRYRWNYGMLAFVLSRVSALLVAGYLVAHIFVTRTLVRGPAGFDRAIATVSHPIFKLLEIGLVGVIICHALVSIVVLTMNLGMRSERRGRMLAVATAVGAVLFIVAAWVMFPVRSAP